MAAPTIDWKQRALAAEACARDLDDAITPILMGQPGEAQWDRFWPTRRQHVFNSLERWQLHQADYDTLDAAAGAVNSAR